MSDLISRQAAIDGMFAEMPGLTFDGVLRVLRNLPSVDAQPVKHGKWEGEDPITNFVCSVCGSLEEYNTNYCPNCGAKMEENDAEIH